MKPDESIISAFLNTSNAFFKNRIIHFISFYSFLVTLLLPLSLYWTNITWPTLPLWNWAAISIPNSIILSKNGFIFARLLKNSDYFIKSLLPFYTTIDHSPSFFLFHNHFQAQREKQSLHFQILGGLIMSKVSNLIPYFRFLCLHNCATLQ